MFGHGAILPVPMGYGNSLNQPVRTSSGSGDILSRALRLTRQSRTLVRQAKAQQESTRMVTYDCLLLEARLLRDEIARINGLAAEVERQQLAAGMRLLRFRRP